jgi:signal peptidase I
MDPALVKGDILVWSPTKIKDIKIGDIVVFKSYIKWPNEKLIAHRVTNIHLDKLTGDLILETKGDANEWKDQDNPSNRIPYIQKDNIQGKVVCIGNHPFKININFIATLLVIFIILLSAIPLYKFISSKYSTFLYRNRSKCNSYREWIASRRSSSH